MRPRSQQDQDIIDRAHRDGLDREVVDSVSEMMDAGRYCAAFDLLDLAEGNCPECGGPLSENTDGCNTCHDRAVSR